MAIGASARRGGAIRSEGSVDSPSIATSLASEGNSAEVACTASTSALLAMWTTNSPEARMLRAVSLSASPRRPMLRAIIGGLGATNVNWLNGARLTMPSSDTVVTHAIGRGTTTPVISL